MSAHDPMSTWLCWMMYAVAGKTGEADGLMEHHGKGVRYFAGFLRRRYAIEPRPLYRGVLLEEEPLYGTLQPRPGNASESFTEDRDVARWFADPDTIISGFVRELHPKVRGFLVTIEPDPASVLFHWSWAQRLEAEGLDLLGAAIQHPHIADCVEQFVWNLRTQKEVILPPAARQVVPYVSPGDTKALDARFGWRQGVIVFVAERRPS